MIRELFDMISFDFMYYDKIILFLSGPSPSSDRMRSMVSNRYEAIYVNAYAVKNHVWIG